MAKKVKVSAGGEKHVVYKKTTKRGKGEPGDIMVNHPTKDKGDWDTINLTKIGRAKTVSEGVAATKKWHKDNPDYKYKKKKK
jgi:signal peptidase I